LLVSGASENLNGPLFKSLAREKESSAKCYKGKKEKWSRVYCQKLLAAESTTTISRFRKKKGTVCGLASKALA